MFWKKEMKEITIRSCSLNIGEKYNQILFVPYGQIANGLNVELDDIIIDNWPCDFGDLQENINKTLDKYKPKYIQSDTLWYSQLKSKAKTIKSFETDYLNIHLYTDISRKYGEGEVERISVSTQPSKLEDTYRIIGCGHLIESKVAQIVIDIYNASMKIRNN